MEPFTSQIKIEFYIEARLANNPVAMGTNKLIMAVTGLERPTADMGIYKVGSLL